MWEPLQGPLASPSDNVKTQTLWVIGTALQNNPAAQKAVRAFFSRNTPTLTLPLAWDASESQCLALDPLPTVLSCLSPSVRSSKQLRSKAIYALSGLLKHNTAVIASFETAGGWDALRGTFSGTITPARSSIHLIQIHLFCGSADSDISVRRKTAFLLSSLTPSVVMTQAVAPPGGRISGAGKDDPQVVHPNSHASIMADPASGCSPCLCGS